MARLDFFSPHALFFHKGQISSQSTANQCFLLCLLIASSNLLVRSLFDAKGKSLAAFSRQLEGIAAQRSINRLKPSNHFPSLSNSACIIFAWMAWHWVKDRIVNALLHRKENRIHAKKKKERERESEGRHQSSPIPHSMRFIDRKADCYTSLPWIISPRGPTTLSLTVPLSICSCSACNLLDVSSNMRFCETCE